jgi:hypothetical protein
MFVLTKVKPRSREHNEGCELQSIADAYIVYLLGMNQSCEV